MNRLQKGDSLSNAPFFQMSNYVECDDVLVSFKVAKDVFIFLFFSLIIMLFIS